MGPYNLVFSDGTGQRGVPDQKGKPGAGSTNIYKMYLAARSNPGQHCFYDPGLGSDPVEPLDWPTWAKNLISKATGLGITENIWNCYEFLVLNHEPDRRIGLFGFSRGAYTVRSLGGLLTLCGIPSPMQNGINIRGETKAEKAARAAVIKRAIGIYQTDYGDKGAPRRKALAATFRVECRCSDANPHVIGVFDTVAALGLPGIMNLVNPFKHEFHNTALSDKVRFGFQALAVDENRKIFKPVLWDEPESQDGPRIEQVWFPGVHSDIGGGYAEQGLSDVTLDWMVSRCRQPEVNVDFGGLSPNPNLLDTLHDERTGFGIFWRPGLRTNDVVTEAVNRAPLAPRIEDRFNAPDLGYRPEALSLHPRTRGFYP